MSEVSMFTYGVPQGTQCTWLIFINNIYISKLQII